MNQKAGMKINFGAGPARLPLEVRQALEASIREWGRSGLSLTEIPHRGRLFREILEEAGALIRELCGLDEEFEVLWLAGGGRAQFATIPMNLFRHPGEKAGFLDSGHWASEACAYARYYGEAEIISSSRDMGYRRLPPVPDALPPLRYVHFTANNTIHGSQYPEFPRLDSPLVADLSSDLFSRPRDYRQLDLFYAVAQKFLGMAGVCLVVIRRSLLETMRTDLPDYFSLRKQVEKSSLVNTPPVVAIGTALLYLRWYKARGLARCLEEIRNRALRLYAAIDRHPLFFTEVEREDRSYANLCFRLRHPENQPAFLAWLEQEYGIVGIDGHRSVGGLRVSLYHGIQDPELDRLLAALEDYQNQSLD